MTQTRQVGFSALLVLGLLLAGCGGADNPLQRQPVSGTVKFNGAPLDQGTIDLSPVVPGRKAVGSGAQIKAGSFSIPAAQGLPPGKYLVRIYSPEGGEGPKDAMPGDTQIDPAAPTAKERIPAKYNVDSQETIEVKPGSPNKFDFQIAAQ
jgi:hypothetical protein